MAYKAQKSLNYLLSGPLLEKMLAILANSYLSFVIL